MWTFLLTIAMYCVLCKMLLTSNWNISLAPGQELPDICMTLASMPGQMPRFIWGFLNWYVCQIPADIMIGFAGL